MRFALASRSTYNEISMRAAHAADSPGGLPRTWSEWSQRNEAIMNMQLMDIVLPSLARRLHRQLERYRAGELDDSQFNRRFEAVREKQYSWVAKQGVPESEAAVAV